ncbi:WhiB family transcriptional regulator [Streptomyces fructofermentans]|uniref:Transcriptional regulator WhiB n=1 Tax=Streptomyces fructofermentans TaxID=152141 RepID=A0A918KC42_9ACTN|nr:WhiB family transcriptional regulator [Streptomyces fructofermentans]GGX57622.1 transcriptional regulator WhiB [Streptomyces fructofermentans]
MSDWRQSAACRTVDPDLFFPIGSTGPALFQVQEAKAVCRGCPVREECLKWALETGQAIGVWGGTTEAERRTLKRRAGAARERSAGRA